MADKVSKQSVGYKLGGDHCDVCQFFLDDTENEDSETGQCSKVEGEIGEDMWCKLFKRRRGKTLAEGG